MFEPVVQSARPILLVLSPARGSALGYKNDPYSLKSGPQVGRIGGLAGT